MPSNSGTKAQLPRRIRPTTIERLRQGSIIAFFHLAFYFVLLGLILVIAIYAVDYDQVGILYRGIDYIGFVSSLLLLNGTLLAFAILVPVVAIQVLGSDFRSISIDVFLKNLFVRIFFLVFIGSLLLDLITLTGLLSGLAGGFYQKVLIDFDTAFAASGILLIPAYFANLLELQHPARLASEVAGHIPSSYSKLLGREQAIYELRQLKQTVERIIEMRDVASLELAAYVPSFVFERWLKKAKKERPSDLRVERYAEITGIFLQMLIALYQKASKTNDSEVFSAVSSGGQALWKKGYEQIPNERGVLSVFPAAMAGMCIDLKPSNHWTTAYIGVLQELSIMSGAAVESRDTETFLYLQRYVSDFIPELQIADEGVLDGLNDSLNWVTLRCLQLDWNSEAPRFLNTLLSAMERSIELALKKREQTLARVLSERFVATAAHTLGNASSQRQGSIKMVSMVLSRVTTLKSTLEENGGVSFDEIIHDQKAKSAEDANRKHVPSPISFLTSSASVISATGAQLDMLEQASQALRKPKGV